MSPDLQTPLAPNLRRVTQQVREVYFVRAKEMGLIKIGVANTARERLVSLQVDSPDHLELLGVIECRNRGALEKQIHQRFAHLRVKGEWFRPGEDLLDYIEDHATPDEERLWRMKCEVVAAIAREPVRQGRRPTA